MASLRKSEARERRRQNELKRLKVPRSPYAEWTEAKRLRAEQRWSKDEKRRFHAWLKKVLKVDNWDMLDIESFLVVEDTDRALAA